MEFAYKMSKPSVFSFSKSFAYHTLFILKLDKNFQDQIFPNFLLSIFTEHGILMSLNIF